MAFPVITEALRRYVADKRRGVFDLHVGTVATRNV
jgi:hypothetical protein